MMQAVFLAGAVVFSAALVVLGCLAIFFGLARNRGPAGPVIAEAGTDAVFIFRDKQMIDCSDRGQALLASLEGMRSQPGEPGQWSAILDYLVPRFPGVEEVLSKLAQTRQASLSAVGDTPLNLAARYENGVIQLRLTDLSDEAALLALDRLGYDALQKELRTLRFVLRNMPALVWQENADGQVIWANAAYLRTLQDQQDHDSILGWPLPALFDSSISTEQARLTLEREGAINWFSHSEVADEESVTHFATPIDAAVQSETARRQTLQTLTRTFSALPIGLALFGADRRLQVFNPALVELTGLQPLFLAARPSFEQLLYSLRESRMLPEPKDFKSWRKEILAMEQAAQDGAYEEEWALGNGRTYLVTGRPQPDGAIALFMQDITTEATLTRSFRAEIDTAQNALDALDQAVAVFGLNGQTLLANAEYLRLWSSDPCADLSDGGLTDALSIWAHACEPTAFWARLAEFVALRLRDTDTGPRRAELEGTARLRSGGELRMKACRLPGGSTLLLFARVERQMISIPDATDVRPHQDLAQALPEPARQESGPMPDTGRSGNRKGRITARHAGNRVRV